MIRTAARALLTALLVSVASTGVGATPLQAIDPEALASAGRVFDEANNARRAGDLEQARAMARELIEWLTSNDTETGGEEAATFLAGCAALADACNDPQAAIDAWTWVVAVRSRTHSSEHEELRTARTELADNLAALGDLDGAEELYAQVLEACERSLPQDHFDLLTAHFNHGRITYYRGDLEEARAIFERVLAGFERTLNPGHGMILTTRLNLGACYKELGDDAHARELYVGVVAEMEKTFAPDDPSLLQARSNLASSLRRLGDTAGALEMERQVLEVRLQTMPPDHPDVLLGRMNIALMLLDFGAMEESEAELESVVEGFRKVVSETHDNLLVAQQNLALVLAETGDYVRARNLQEQVIRIREQTLPEDHLWLCEARTSLAATMFEMGDLAGARAMDERVLESYERTRPQNPRLLPTAQSNLASVLVMLGELEHARELQQKSVAGFEACLPPSARRLLTARNNLSVTLARLGEAELALQQQKALWALYCEHYSEDHPEALHTLSNMAASTYVLGRLDEARELHLRVIAALERTLPDDHHALLAARQGLIRNLIDLEAHEEALAQLQGLSRATIGQLERILALSPREAREVAGFVRGLLPDLRHWSRELGPRVDPTVFEMVETLRHVSNAYRREPIERSDTELFELWQRASAARAEVHELATRGPAAAQTEEAYSKEIQELALARDAAEREIATMLAARGRTVRRTAASAVAAALPERTFAVAYHRWPADADSVDDDRFVAYVLEPNGALQLIELGRAAELEQLAARWRRALGRPIDHEADGATLSELETGRALRAAVIDPVLAGLEDPEAFEAVHVCADDFLHAIPLDALPTRSARLGESLRIVTEVSFARLLATRRASSLDPSLVALGGAEFGDSPSMSGESIRAAVDAGFAPLLGSQREVESVGQLFEACFDTSPALLVGAGATKSALAEAATGARFLHVATHGWFAQALASEATNAPGPDGPHNKGGADLRRLAPLTLCGLALTGANGGHDALGRVAGVLTAEELAGFDLSGCELAVLSACETNVGMRGAGQGVLSLQAALHNAGVRTAVTSLWKVDDEATRALMQHFYAALWREGLGKSEALWKAKRALRAERYPTESWAGWILTGDPD